MTTDKSALPVSPPPYFAELTSAIGEGWYDCRGTGLVVTLLETVVERLLCKRGCTQIATTPEACSASRRASPNTRSPMA